MDTFKKGIAVCCAVVSFTGASAAVLNGLDSVLSVRVSSLIQAATVQSTLKTE